MTMPNGGAMPPMPPGIGTSSASNPGTGTAASPPGAAPITGWSPPFQIGKGKTGVFTDPREQIAGGTSTDITAADANNPTGNPGGTPGTPSDPNSVQYSSPGTGSPGAGTLPSGGALNNTGPAPKLHLPGTIEQQVQEGMNY